MNSIRRLLAAITLAWPALAVHASGGSESSQVVSVPRAQPEPTAMPAYVHGHLGVLWPSYDRATLMMAYRQAMGHAALAPADVAAWTQPPSAAAAALGDDWLTARHAAGAADKDGSATAGARATGQFSYAGNCQPDAFRLAAATLRARTQAHAGQAAAIADWIAAQDAVFAACDHPDAATPAPAAPGAPAWLRQDRAYQQAASLLYLGRGEDAAQAFAAIAADAGSPWKEWAAYLQARAWWRDTFKEAADYKTYAAQSPDWQHAPMPARLAVLSAQARDPAVRQAAAALLDTVRARIEPREVHRALWQRIDAAEPPADLAAWVADERFLWALMKDEDVADDWLFLTRSIDPVDAASPNAAALSDRWARHPTPAWLAAALMAAHPATPGIAPVLAASRELKPSDPLYLHGAWQRGRLALERRDFADARRELAAARAHLDGEALGTRQAFDQLEMLAAPSLAAVAGHLQRLPLLTETESDGSVSVQALAAGAPRTPFLDDETRTWLATQLDGQEMLALARDATLATPVRQDLAGGAWLRGALLGRDTLEADAVKLLGALGADADAVAATTPLEQRFRMGRHLLLHELTFIEPRMQSTRFTEAWWRTAPAFHDAEAAARAARTSETLVAANQTTWLVQAMLPWLRLHRSAEGPALLEKLVYASRYGQRDTQASRAAFQLLHQQYPNSPEAQRTPYYF